MKICLVNLTTKEILDDVYLANLNKKKYCEKYNIDYRFYLGRASKRHAQWDKIQCVLQNLSEYDYIIWMDSDAVFNNFDVSIIDIINNNQEYDALFCSDVCYSEGQNHLLVNTGVMVFKNSQWSFDILNKVWNSVSDYSIENLKKHSYEGFPHEQGKLCEELIREDESKFKIFPSSVFNQHPNSSNNQTFVIHHMGSRQTENHIQTFKQKVIDTNNRLQIDCNSQENINYIKLKPLNICIVSSYTDNISAVADVTIPNKEAYCKKHNYQLYVNKGRLSLRHPGWDKIKLILKRMDIDDCDYFVWIDNDAYITNDSLKFDFICNNYSDKNFIICAEEHVNNLKELNSDIDFNNLQNLRLINTGVFIIKNNEWGKRFLEEIWETKSNTNQGIHCSHAEIPSNSFTYDFWPFEQGPLHIALSKKNKNDYKIFPCQIMNVFRGQHKKHHFVCHFVGTHNNVETINQYVYQLSNDDEIIQKMSLIESKEHEIDFKNNKCYLKYKIYANTSNDHILKYEWNYSNTHEEHLSHCFRINNKKEISFGSDKNGKIKYKLGDIIEHSYDWFGEKNWIRII
jgi:hypothetical protein